MSRFHNKNELQLLIKTHKLKLKIVINKQKVCDVWVWKFDKSCPWDVKKLLRDKLNKSQLHCKPQLAMGYDDIVIGRLKKWINFKLN
jgi:hypothetical protein